MYKHIYAYICIPLQLFIFRCAIYCIAKENFAITNFGYIMLIMDYKIAVLRKKEKKNKYRTRLIAFCLIVQDGKTDELWSNF